ncbi:UDP-3-O-acyl-N-acetylglucosamine deacetylase [Candidatus Woesearchaeota archaeon]|nr:UDP-3-O-acyl-N-acetylglucosamine deacetylase [Candidatus Woesearchaeota archaeon]
MSLQKTIGKTFELEGLCFYSGNPINALFHPASEDTGILFNTVRGNVKHSLQNAVPCRRSILLKDGPAKIINVEHVTSTLKYGYGIDNVYIIVRRMPPKKKSQYIPYFTHFTDTEVFPNTGDEELTLCRKLDEVGVVEQGKENIMLTLRQPFITDKLSFLPIDHGIFMHATTDYFPIGEQTFEIEMTPENYKKELAGARRYAEHVKYLNFLPVAIRDRFASFLTAFANPSYGLGHGFSVDNVFLPVSTEEQWKAQEKYDAEIARHTIVDRLGALALIDGRLDGIRCVMKFSNHINDIAVLNEMDKVLSRKVSAGRKVYKGK